VGACQCVGARAVVKTTLVESKTSPRPGLEESESRPSPNEKDGQDRDIKKHPYLPVYNICAMLETQYIFLSVFLFNVIIFCITQ
jgi:hypothetical protein